MSNHEKFEMVTRPYGDSGQYRSHARIVCSKCSKDEVVPANNSGTPNRSFHNRGWIIGNRRNQDVCPECRVAQLTKSRLSNSTILDPGALNAYDKAVDVLATDVAPVNPVMQEKLKPAMEKVIHAAVVPDKPTPDARHWPEFVHHATPRGPQYVRTCGFGSKANAQRGAVFYLQRGHNIPKPRDGADYIVRQTQDGGWRWMCPNLPVPEPYVKPAQSSTPKPRLTPTPAAIPAAPEKAPEPMEMPSDAVFAELVGDKSALTLPTRADKQRIGGGLDVRYDMRNERYKEDWSDAKLAETLDVPRAWVTQVRVDMYGDHDRNEINDAAFKALKEALAQAERAEAKLLDMAQEAERIATNLKAQLAKLTGG